VETLDKLRKKTNKPCPGCGYAPDWRRGRGYRYVDEVCNECKRLMQEAKAHREQLAARENGVETVILRGPKSYHDIESSAVSYSDETYDRFRKALCELAKALSTPITAHFDGWRDHTDSLFRNPTEGTYEVRWAGLREYPLDIAGLLQEFELTVRQAVEDAYLQGYANGTDVVERLRSTVHKGKLSGDVRELFDALLSNVMEATKKERTE
jgi:hypothetical protein